MKKKKKVNNKSTANMKTHKKNKTYNNMMMKKEI